MVVTDIKYGSFIYFVFPELEDKIPCLYAMGIVLF